MIEVELALAWINREKSSEISDPIWYQITMMGDSLIPQEERKQIIFDLTKLVKRFLNPLERAEVLVYCGARGYLLGMIDEAEVWLETAAEIYEKYEDLHRHSVTLWILFIVKLRQGKFKQAVDVARGSQRLFGEIADDRMKKQLGQEENWYRSRIQDMICDLLSSPETVFEYLYEFHGSNLAPSALDIKNTISFMVEKKNIRKIDDEMDLLLGISLRSLDPNEAAEALAYCGVVSWALENKSEAMLHFRSAMTQYLPISYEYAVVQWMLGLVQYWYPSDRFNAIANMEASIQTFEKCRLKAIHDNNMGLEKWYAIHHNAMKRILRTRLDRS